MCCVTFLGRKLTKKYRTFYQKNWHWAPKNMGRGPGIWTPGSKRHPQHCIWLVKEVRLPHCKKAAKNFKMLTSGIPWKWHRSDKNSKKKLLKFVNIELTKRCNQVHNKQRTKHRKRTSNKTNVSQDQQSQKQQYGGSGVRTGEAGRGVGGGSCKSAPSNREVCQGVQKNFKTTENIQKLSFRNQIFFLHFEYFLSYRIVFSLSSNFFVFTLP